MKLFLGLIAPLFLLTCNLAVGQSAINDEEISWLIPESEDTTGLGVEGLVYSVKEYHLGLSVLANVTDLQVQIGLEPGSDDFLGRTFPLTESIEYDDGSAIIVNGADIDIRLGYFQGLRRFNLRLTALNEEGGVLESVDMEYPNN